MNVYVSFTQIWGVKTERNVRTSRGVTSARARRIGLVSTVRKGRTTAMWLSHWNSAATVCALINRRWSVTLAFAIRSVSPRWTNFPDGVFFIELLYFNKGWMKEGGAACTKDVDECKTNQHTCSTNPPVECRNTRGSFTCGNCPAGKDNSTFNCNILCNFTFYNYLFRLRRRRFHMY